MYSLQNDTANTTPRKKKKSFTVQSNFEEFLHLNTATQFKPNIAHAMCLRVAFTLPSGEFLDVMSLVLKQNQFEIY
jgi:hypothetical protein